MPPALRGYVPIAHGYQMPASPAGIHRGLPSRHLTLVIELADRLSVSGLGEPVASHGVLGGLHTSPALIDASRPQEGLQYALSPPMCEALLGVPARALAGAAFDVVDVLGSDGERLIDQVASTSAWEERFGLVDRFLLDRLDRGAPADPLVAETWHRVFVSGHRLEVARLAESVGYSRRHLSERFRAAIGIPPQAAMRIARLERAHSLLLSRHRLPLAQIAFSAGFADQAHFAREWKAMTASTVTTWLREELPIVQDAELESVDTRLYDD